MPFGLPLRRNPTVLLAATPTPSDRSVNTDCAGRVHQGIHKSSRTWISSNQWQRACLGCASGKSISRRPELFCCRFHAFKSFPQALMWHSGAYDNGNQVDPAYLGPKRAFQPVIHSSKLCLEYFNLLAQKSRTGWEADVNSRNWLYPRERYTRLRRFTHRRSRADMDR